MGKVRFLFPNGDEVEVEGYEQLNLLAHAQLIERSLQSRCGGHAECGTCRIRLEAGRLSAMRDEEKRLLAEIGVSDRAVRLACQCFPELPEAGSTVVIRVPGERFVDARAQKRKKQTLSG